MRGFFGVSNSVSIQGLSKAKVLAALFNASKQQGLGRMDMSGVSEMTEEDAGTLVEDGLHFDYLRGRVLKVDLAEDEFNPRLYDRDNGPGAAAAAIATIV